MRTLSVINPKAAGIDVGSEKLFVSIAGDEPVVFGTVTDEVYRLRDFLKQSIRPGEGHWHRGRRVCFNLGR